MTTADIIHNLDAALMRAWPALMTEYYDGWILRFAEGYSRRSNSIHPIFSSSLPILTKITHCEAAYTRHNLPTLFKISPVCFPGDLDSVLAKRGYERVFDSMVMTRNLENQLIESDERVQLSSQVSPQWLQAYIELEGADPTRLPVVKRFFRAILPDVVYARIVVDGRIVALGFAIHETNVAGLYQLFVEPAMRRQGLGTAISQTLMAWGQQKGAKLAYGQILIGQESPYGLLHRAGFDEAYTYWYRVRL